MDLNDPKNKKRPEKSFAHIMDDLHNRQKKQAEEQMDQFFETERYRQEISDAIERRKEEAERREEEELTLLRNISESIDEKNKPPTFKSKLLKWVIRFIYSVFLIFVGAAINSWFG